MALIIAAEAVLFSRLLHTGMDFDEGFYLASLAALRDGQTLGTQVFAPQPPGFYALLRLVGSLVGPNAEQVREGFIALAALGTLGAFALARGWALALRRLSHRLSSSSHLPYRKIPRVFGPTCLACGLRSSQPASPRSPRAAKTASLLHSQGSRALQRLRRSALSFPQ